ncbi:PIG-L deacetylase family protein [Kribbella deserti]|uniref:PIG-L deacetylase family protein n=2 Tax=Kribbella deserti TaxID=1926257 RepID=A0ABV6QMY9_9ACTN
MPEWQRMLAVVAHPDDLEYGAASAIARWTAEGRSVSYLLVTRGEAGIDGLSPEKAGPIREDEQRASAAVVGVEDVTFLDYPDGTVAYGVDLRADITAHIRRVRPDVLLTTTGELTYGERSLNQADHRVVSLAALDAARDAGNRWIHRDQLDEGLEPWNGVEHVYLIGTPTPTHGVDVSDWLDKGIASLCQHRAYLDGLGREFDPEMFIRMMTAHGGQLFGSAHAVVLEQIQLAGV